MIFAQPAPWVTTWFGSSPIIFFIFSIGYLEDLRVIIPMSAYVPVRVSVPFG